MNPFSLLLQVNSTFDLIAIDCYGLGRFLGQGPTQDGFFQDRSSHCIHTYFLSFHTFLVVVGSCGLQLHGQYINDFILSLLHHQIYTRIATVHLNHLQTIRQCLLVLFNFSILALACLLHFSRILPDCICACRKQLTFVLQIH